MRNYPWTETAAAFLSSRVAADSLTIAPTHPALSLSTQGGNDTRPGAAARREIDNAARDGNVDNAFCAFESAVTNGDPLTPHSCNVLLHLCAGGNVVSQDETYATDDAPKPVVPDAASVHPERANVVFNHMVSHDIQRTEMTYTALARVEAAAGEPRRAFDVAKRLPGERLRPKLRTLAPALHAFCLCGDIDGALEVEQELLRHEIELTEAEFAVLLKARRVKGEWAEGLQVITQAADVVKTFYQTLGDECTAFFQEMPGWSVADTVTVNHTSGAAVGTFKTTDGGFETKHVQLRAVHLTKQNRADLLAGIGKLSRERESADHFDGFVTWLKRRGPLPFLVDGANVGMYNQNFSGSGFNFHQVEKVMHRLRSSSRAARAERVAAMKVDGAFEGKTGEASEGKKEEQPEGKKEESAEKKELQPEEKNTETEGNTTETEEKKAETPTETAETTAGTKNTDPSSAKPKTEPVSDASVLDSAEKSHGANCPVVFLHVRRVRGGPANSQKARDTLDTWKRNGELFTTPAGSNDDWYVLTFPNHDTVSSPCLRNRLFAHIGYLYTQD